MNMALRRLLWLASMLAGLAWCPGRGAELELREANFGSFSVITDAKDKEVANWVAQFDEFRRVAQDLMQIRDEQLLPLTVVLLSRQDDLRDLTSPLQQQVGEVLNLAVGLGKQPMIATALDQRTRTSATKLRSSIVMWLLSSAGLQYDPWIVQGCIDFMGNLEIRGDEVKTGRTLEEIMKDLNRNTKYAAPRGVELERVPSEPAYAWVVLHYLLIGRNGWQGMAPLTAYQRAVATGVERQAAFATAFGLDLPVASTATNAFLKRGRAPETRLLSRAAIAAPAVQLQPLAAGVRDCLLAQFMIQQAGADMDKARARIERAAELMPDDVHVWEAWWFYYIKAMDSSQAREVLNRAIRAGTRNQFLRTQWCIDVMNDRVLSTGGFLCEPDVAREAADTLAELIRANPYAVSSYKMLAQFAASIVPARASDRQLLEAGRKAMPHNLLINLGLVAWDWRTDDLAGAKAALAALNPAEAAGGPIGPAYASWLDLQLEASTALREIQTALKAEDYVSAQAKYSAYPTKPLRNLPLQREFDAARLELEYQDIFIQAEENWKNGSREAAESLLQTVMEAAVSPALHARAEALLKQIRQKSSGG